ncbi:MAG: Arc family DNA-binding protein [Anaerolineae bacterium]|nr:Arc family DNA-binding protein [Anaerolineae bacterium]
MPTFAINIPPDLYERVRISAHIHRRSINQEILRRLETSLPAKRIDADSLLSRVDALQKDIACLSSPMNRFKK